jgi:phytoene dehydrogenase-like protein
MPSRQVSGTSFDSVIIGSGHNGLVAAAYLASAGHSVLVLERNDWIGGATASQKVFPDYDAWLSRYSYLVSLFPQTIIDELGLDFRTRRRTTASFTPYIRPDGNHAGLLLSNTDQEISRQSVNELAGNTREWEGYQRLLKLEAALADIAWPTLLQPLRTREQFRKSLATEDQREAWQSFVETPLGVAIERHLENDVLRGLVVTDGKIGVFADSHDESLIQNRCFLYHVIGGGTGEWKVPVGGMRSLVDGLVARCRSLGVQFATRAPATRIAIGNNTHAVDFMDDQSPCSVDTSYVLVNAGPRTFSRLTDTSWEPSRTDEGSVIKINMLLKRLPRLRARGVTPEQAFAGSLHLDEGYQYLREANQMASRGQIPDPAPGETYCHTLTDDSILSPELRARGYQTITLFGLEMPYRLFATADHDARKKRVLESYLAGLDRICDEPFSDCLALDRNGNPCIEIKSPQDIEQEVDLDLGNIFHNSLTWFFTDDDSQAGTWGVETGIPRVFRAGASAFRGGAVSGIPGRCAAMAVLGKH